MNKWCGIGRLTKDPEIKLTTNQTKFCQFTLAVDRRFKDQNGQRQADLNNSIAWRQTADGISKNLKRGNRIGVIGSIQTRSYEDDNGQKRFVTEVVIDEAEFVETNAKLNEETETAPDEEPAQNVQQQSPQTEDSGELPFEI